MALPICKFCKERVPSILLVEHCKENHPESVKVLEKINQEFNEKEYSLTITDKLTKEAQYTKNKRE